MSGTEIDVYLGKAPAPFRAAIEALRRRVLEYLRNREIDYVERMSYGMPGVLILPHKKMVAGYAAHKNHCGFYPHSGTVLGRLDIPLGDRGHTKSALHFTAENPIEDDLLFAILDLRMAEITASPPQGSGNLV